MTDEALWNASVESLSVDELRETVERPGRIAQLCRVFEESPFYRRKFAEAGIERGTSPVEIAWESLPFTEKSELLADQREQPPFGSNLCVPMAEVRRVHRTSGYTDRPLYIPYTDRDIQSTLEAGASAFWCAGVRPDDLIIHCMNYCLWTGGLTDHQCLEHTGACVIPFGIGGSKGLLEVIRTLRPTAISCTPSYLPRLETVLHDEFGMVPSDLGLRKALLGGEPGIQDPRFRSRIEATWGMQAIDANYGVSDVLTVFGAECSAQDGLHFHGQGVLGVELIDPATGLSVELHAGTTGEFVYTNLVREAQPLIRYRSHDLVEIVGTDRCSCGRRGFRFRVLGRSDDMLIVKGINVFPHAIGATLAGHSERLTGEYEILVRTPPPLESLKVRVETRGADEGVDLQALKSLLEEEIRLHVGIRPIVELAPEGALCCEGNKARHVRRVTDEVT